MSMSISGLGGPGAFQRMDPSQMKAQGEQAISKLKETDSDLADKLTKIDSRMNELREAGTDPKTAKQTIDSEFGQLSDKELSEIREAMGGAGGMRRMQVPPPGPPPGASGTGGANDKSVDDLLKELTSALKDDSSDSSDSSSTSSTSSSNSTTSADTVWSDFRQLAQLLAQKYGSSAQTGYGQSYFGSQGFIA